MADLDKILNRFAALVLAENGGYKNNGLAETKQAINQLCLSEFLELLGEDEKPDESDSPQQFEYRNKLRNRLRADLRTKALEKWGRNE